MPFLLRVFLLFQTIAIGLTAIAMASASASAAEVDITVVANSTKASGQPWDGIGDIMLGPAITGAKGPPDLVVCIIDRSGQDNCQFHPRRAGSSRCQDSFDCDWDNVSIPDGMFGVVILDLDMAQHDFVDAAIFLSRPDQKRSPEADNLESVMRVFINRLAPATLPGERMRREREFQRMPISLCAEDSCTLRQSKILMLPSRR